MAVLPSEPGPLSFRASTPDDAAAVFEIWSRSVAATHDFLSPEDFAEIAALVRREYAPRAKLLLAERGGRILGFMGMTGLMIDAIFIDPDAFGQGIGRAFIEEARKAGGPLRVDVNEQNTGARAFYERLGFIVQRRSEVDAHGRPYPILHLVEGE